MVLKHAQVMPKKTEKLVISKLAKFSVRIKKTKNMEKQHLLKHLKTMAPFSATKLRKNACKTSF